MLDSQKELNKKFIDRERECAQYNKILTVSSKENYFIASNISFIQFFFNRKKKLFVALFSLTFSVFYHSKKNVKWFRTFLTSHCQISATRLTLTAKWMSTKAALYTNLHHMNLVTTQTSLSKNLL